MSDFFHLGGTFHCSFGFETKYMFFYFSSQSHGMFMNATFGGFVSVKVNSAAIPIFIIFHCLDLLHKVADQIARKERSLLGDRVLYDWKCPAINLNKKGKPKKQISGIKYFKTVVIEFCLEGSFRVKLIQQMKKEC